ncbi:MAG: dihydroorotase [Spirochaetaceae bacterium]|nr:dihydroorotase [Spirochaetaceae bacterium]
MKSFSDKISIRKPDDMHLHLRQGEILKVCAPESAKWFQRAMIMPNTIPPIINSERLISYRKEIEEAVFYRNNRESNIPKENFTPLMSFKLYPGMKEEEVIKLSKAGAVAGKLYPEGSTTNSEDGVKSWKQITEALSAMSKLGIILAIHGEKPDSFVLDREKDYLPELFQIIEHYPDLKIVLEHVSSVEGVNAVINGPVNLGGTITIHHLLITLDDLLGGGINPHNFCKPVVKTPKDREAIQNAALSGNRKFFFGSDSAPHPESLKIKTGGNAGIFSAPVAFPLLVSFFEKNGSKELLENFTSRYGAEFYNLPLNSSSITLERKESKVPERFSDIVPFMAGATIEWDISTSE